MVVADDAYRAADAVQIVVVHYEPLPAAVTAGRGARGLGAARVHRRVARQACGRVDGVGGRQGRAMASASGRGGRGVRLPSAGGGHAHRAARRPGSHDRPRRAVDRLALDPGTLRGADRRSPRRARHGRGARARSFTEVGGGFGVKGHVYPEDVLRAGGGAPSRPAGQVDRDAARALPDGGAPTAISRHDARLGVSRTGRIVALETEFTRDHGAHPTLGEAITLQHDQPSARALPDRAPQAASGVNVVTHKTFSAAYRGAGRPEAAYVLDRLLDRAARRAGIDPAALRRRNLIRPEEMPYATGLTLPRRRADRLRSRGLSGCVRPLLDPLRLRGWRAEQVGAARVPAADRDRPVRLRGGHGHRAVRGRRRQGRSERDGLSSRSACPRRARRTRPRWRRSARPSSASRRSASSCRAATPPSSATATGTIASRVAAVAGPAVARTAREVARKAQAGRRRSSSSARPSDVVLAGGARTSRAVTERGVDTGRLARAVAAEPRRCCGDGGPGLMPCAFFRPGTVTWAFGAHAVALEVDVETGALRLLELRRGARLRPPHQPDDRGGPAPRRNRRRASAPRWPRSCIYDDAGPALTGSPSMEYGVPKRTTGAAARGHRARFSVARATSWA